MTGSVRENTAGLRARLDERRGDPGLSALPGDLFAAADLIGQDPLLRGALSDAGQPSAARTGMVITLFGDRLSPLAVEVLGDVVAQRWAGPVVMLEAVEELAAQADFLVAEQAGNLDAVEDDLFGFAQALAGSADLQMALTDPSVGPAEKASLVRTLLTGRSTPQATEVLAYAMGHLRGRRAGTVLEYLIDLAAEQRGRSVAEVVVARELEPDQAERLAAVLSRLNGRDVRLNVVVDPEVVGGIAVRIGEQVIDGTMATRIQQARRALVG
jgi:F-type H+-transporting ATPase subunit delta